MPGSVFTKTGQLFRLMVRRDYLRIPLWIIGITFFTLLVPLALADLYPSQQERDVMAGTMENPAMTAMVGPGDLDHYTIGAMTAHQMLLMTAAVVGLMSILLVTRHTRADEEDGRIEMIRALPVGRLSNLHAALSVLCITNVLLALITGLGLYALGIESMDLTGSLLYGAALGATGIFFAGVTALFAQLSESSRGTTGFSIAVLVIAYLVRAIGDVSNETLSWFSPLGWVTEAGVYADNNGWSILLMIGAAVLLFAAAYYLHGIRDLGAGFLPSRPGRQYASFFLRNPIGLAFRLQRTGIIAWAIGMFLVGVSYGSVLGDLESFFEGNEILKQLLKPVPGLSRTEQFLPMLMVVMAVLGSIPPIMAMNKLYREEKKNRIEHLLGRAVSRIRLMASYLLIAAINGFAMISLAAIALWMAGTTVMSDPLSFETVYGAAIVYYPAILVMIGVAVLLIGWVPRLSSLNWFYLLYAFIVLYLGGIFQFPDWVGQLSPYGHVPQLPVEEMDAVAISTLVALAIVLTVIGFIGYRKRDMQG